MYFVLTLSSIVDESEESESEEEVRPKRRASSLKGKAAAKKKEVLPHVDAVNRDVGFNCNFVNCILVGGEEQSCSKVTPCRSIPPGRRLL